jgi:F-type H+-transporting ATPase subunit delta
VIRVSIAQRYARALFDVGLQANQHNELGYGLDAMAHALAASAELRAVMDNPAVGSTSRHQVLELLVTKLQSPPLAANLFRLLVDRNRLGYVEAIARSYRDLVDARANRVRAKVVSAVPLEDTTVTTLQSHLAQLTKKTVSVEKVVDPRILGGVIAQVGSLTFDGSLASQLESLRRQLSPV